MLTTDLIILILQKSLSQQMTIILIMWCLKEMTFSLLICAICLKEDASDLRTWSAKKLYWMLYHISITNHYQWWMYIGKHSWNILPIHIGYANRFIELIENDIKRKGQLSPFFYCSLVVYIFSSSIKLVISLKQILLNWQSKQICGQPFLIHLR